MKFAPCSFSTLLFVLLQQHVLLLPSSVNGEGIIPSDIIGIADDAGYVMCAEHESSLGYQWIDINEPSTVASFEDDHTLTFPFKFYGITYDKIIPTDEGIIHFDSSYYERLGVHTGGFSKCGLPTYSTYRAHMPPEFVAVFNQPLGPNYASFGTTICLPWDEFRARGRELVQSSANENNADGSGVTYHLHEEGSVIDDHHHDDRSLQNASPTSPPTTEMRCIYYPDEPTSTFHFKNFDVCPVGGGKCAIAQWHDYARLYTCIESPDYPGAQQWVDHMEFQAILFENGDIHLQYKSTANHDAVSDVEDSDSNYCYVGGRFPSGEHTVVGIQGSPSSSPVHGLEYTCLTRDLFPGLAISFQAPGNQGTACKVPEPESVSEPEPLEPISSVCTEQGLDIACFFNVLDQENKGFTNICVKTVGEDGNVRYRNTCKRNDILAGLVPGDNVPTMDDDTVLARCGCCDRCNGQDDAPNVPCVGHSKSCKRAICTPESDPDNWIVCEAWGNGLVNTIKVCITHEDGSEEEACVSPFFVPKMSTDTIRCGYCASSV